MLARVLPLLERFNRTSSAVGTAAVFDNADFAWVPAVEREWRTVRDELLAVLGRKNELPGFQDILPGVESVTHDRGWKSFIFVGMGIRSERNIAACPQTWRVLQQIPGLSMAMFSIFEPGKRLPPHRGPYNGVLRFHLGLIVPGAGEAAIRVGPDVRRWREGEALIFDDTYEHEAWNGGDGVRVVLFADFARPLRFPANVVNAALLKVAALSPFIREGHANHRQWERGFYRD